MPEIVHWVWQGVALVALVSVCMGHARRISASMRCRVWWATLALVVALPLLRAMDLPGAGAVLGVDVPVETVPAVTTTTTDAIPVGTSWLSLLLWAACAGWLVVNGSRIHAALAGLDAAKRACRPFPVVRERQLSRWKAVRNRGRRATLVVSDHVRAAGVLGLGYPRIAVAPDLVSALTDEELDQLVLHEYAHVQRHDDMASAIQMILRLVLGWHPAVWWIDRRLRVEREVACDDWVVAATADPRTYARCLTRIADLAAGAESMLVPAAGRRHLTTRVVRLLDAQRNTSTRPSAFALAAATALVALASIGLAGNQTSAVPLPAVARVGGLVASVRIPSTLARLPEPPPKVSRRQRRAAPRYTDAAPASRSELAVESDVLASDTLAASHMAEVAAPIAPDAIMATLEIDPVTDATASEADPHPGAAHDVDRPSLSGDASMLVSEAPLASDEDPSWLDHSRRAVITAGKVAGQSVAGAGVNAGIALKDAGVATGRFFSRLGRSLARPF